MSDIKCAVCGASLPLTLEDHYIVHNNDKIGSFVNLSSREEITLFDACDCPVCGCQHVYQERKRRAESVRIIIDEDDEQEFNREPEVEKVPDAWIVQDMVNKYIEDGDHTYEEAAANFGIPRNAIACIMDQWLDRMHKK